MNGKKPNLQFAKRIFSDHRLWWLAVFAALSILIFQLKYYQAFPSAALELNVPRAKIYELAQDWRQKLGYTKPNTIDCTTFYQDDDIKTFLEFELGSERANELMRSEVTVFAWMSRFCRQYDAEECTVTLATNGKFLGFSHTLENDSKIPELSHEEAEKMARDFVETTGHQSLADFKIVKDETAVQLNRKDHLFTWENRAKDYKGARMRVFVRVAGNQVTAFNSGLYLPEEWRRRYEKIRSYNMQLYNIARGFYAAFLSIAVFIFLWAITRHKIRWKVSLVLSGAFALIALLESFNNIPEAISSYRTELGFNGYMANYILGCVFSGAAYFLIGLCLAGTAEYIYRVACPKKVAIENWLKPAGLRSIEVTKGLVVAHFAAMIYLGWVISYYLLGKKIGFYTPLSVESYQTLVSSIVPAFSAVSLGVFAASHEESLYRVVALCLSQLLLKRIPVFAQKGVFVFWLCNLFQAAAWGFMHSTYPQQPCYARGIELTCSGLLFGWVFQTFGLLPCLVSHYLLDCFLEARPLLDSLQPMLSATAAMAISPFLLLTLFAFSKSLRMAGVSDDEEITNESVEKRQEPLHVQGVEAAGHFDYVALSVRARKILSVIFVVALTTGILICRQPSVGETARLTINRPDAERLANQSLEKRGISPADYMKATTLGDDSTGDQMQYLFEKKGLAQTILLANLSNFGYSWTTRFFRPNEVREYRCVLDGRGHEFTFGIVDSETAGGANLSPERARRLAIEYLVQNHHEYTPFVVNSIAESHRDNRTDYSLSFAVPAFKVGEAPCKISCDLIGDKVCNFDQLWQVPDKWKNDRKKKNLKDEVASGISQVSRLLMIILVCWWAIGLLRSGVVRWRLALLICGISVLLELVSNLNGLSQFYVDYKTAVSLDNYTFQQVMGILQRMLGGFLLSITSTALALGAFKMIAPNADFLLILRIGFKPATSQEKVQQRQLWLDAVLVGFAMAVFRWLLSDLSFLAAVHFSPAVAAASLSAVSAAGNCAIPSLDLLTACLSSVIKQPATYAIWGGLYYKYAGSFKKFLLWTILIALITYLEQRYWQTYVISSVGMTFEWLCMYWLIARFARNNIFAYAVFGVGSEVISRLEILLGHAPRVMLTDICGCLVVLSVPVLYVVWLFSRKIEKQPDESLRE